MYCLRPEIPHQHDSLNLRVFNSTRTSSDVSLLRTYFHMQIFLRRLLPLRPLLLFYGYLSSSCLLCEQQQLREADKVKKTTRNETLMLFSLHPLLLFIVAFRRFLLSKPEIAEIIFLCGRRILTVLVCLASLPLL